MKLLKIGIYPVDYLRQFYTARPELFLQDYSQQHRTIIEDCFGSSNFWTSALEKLHYETCDLISNAEILQKKWAQENDVRFSDANWLEEITIAQIADFAPDILLIADYTTLTGEFLREVRRECPTVKLILGWCGAPYQNLDIIRQWDAALSCVPEMVDEFRHQGLQSFHINHAFSAAVLDRIDLDKAPHIDFSFVGSVLKHSRFHIEREKLLNYLTKKTDLQIWSNIKPESFYQRLKQTLKNSDGIDRRIMRRTKPAVYGLKMFQKLRDSRVVFNNHIDISPNSASNMRLFEATGVGSCLLTDWKSNLKNLFEPETEVLTYKSPEECVEKLNYVLDHENVRLQIADAGQRRTLREHGFDQRALQIDEIIKQIY